MPLCVSWGQPSHTLTPHHPSPPKARDQELGPLSFVATPLSYSASETSTLSNITSVRDVAGLAGVRGVH